MEKEKCPAKNDHPKPIKTLPETCPMCAHACPLRTPSCRRGNDYAAALLAEMSSK